jgi:uncharacterized protein YyaL (SSP411 family)
MFLAKEGGDRMNTKTVPNRLAKSNSPYLRLHANNQVSWYEWGEEAFEKARGEDKPVFLSIGYS